MGRKLRIALLVFGLLLFSGFIGLFVFVRDVDPPYHGKRLSAWAQEIVPWQGPNTPQAETLKRYGSNAAPLIVMMVNVRDSALKKNIIDWLNKQPINKFKTQYRPASTTQMGGLKAAIVLGSEVSSAAPAISKLVGEYPLIVKDPVIAQTAVYVLATLGPDGVPGLIQALDSSDLQIRAKAAELLGRDADAATPEVVAALQKSLKQTGPLANPEAQHSLDLIYARLAQKLPASAMQWTDSTNEPAIHPSVWSTLNGTRILSSSTVYPGFSASDMLGTRLGGLGAEQGTTIFNDSAPDGTTNWVEWQTPSPVTVQSFGLVGFHQPADQFFERSFRAFRLYAWNDEQNTYSQVYSEVVGVPYGDGYFSSLLFLFRNLGKPVTAQRFKAEFVQNGTMPFSGARVIALYGFTNKLDLATALSALKNLAPENQQEGRRFLTEQARIGK